jgi:hypothetical protein
MVAKGSEEHLGSCTEYAMCLGCADFTWLYLSNVASHFLLLVRELACTVTVALTMFFWTRKPPEVSRSPAAYPVCTWF